MERGNQVFALSPRAMGVAEFDLDKRVSTLVGKSSEATQDLRFEIRNPKSAALTSRSI
jgi:hypothetical protein